MVFFPAGTPAWLALLVSFFPFFLVAVIVSLPVAWLFNRKGYEYWRFFLIALLVGPFLSLALYLLLPVLFPPDGKARAKAKSGKPKSPWSISATPKL